MYVLFSGKNYDPLQIFKPKETLGNKKVLKKQYISTLIAPSGSVSWVWVYKSKKGKKILTNPLEDIWKTISVNAVVSAGINILKPKYTHRVFLES